MKFSIIEIEYEGQWGGDKIDKEFSTLAELVTFIKEVQRQEQYIYRFVIYDPPEYPNEGYTGFISIAPDE